MRNAYLSVSLLLLMASSVFAQQDITGSHPSGYLYPNEIKEMPANQVEAPAQSEIKSVIAGTHPKGGDMYVIGLNRPVNLTVANSGEWTTVPGHKVWRLKIKSEGAQALSFLYSDFYLPEGAQVFVYNSDFTHKSRAYAGIENPTGKSFATEAIVGDEVVLEYMAPDYITEAPVLNMEAVTYIFRSGETFQPRNAGQNGASDACQVNVNCSPEGNNWQDQKRGVAKIIVVEGGQAGLCTGSLVNNTAQDCKNYFLTAQHCGAGATAANMNQWTFYFNFESPNCNDLNSTQAGAADNQTRTGCTERASSGTVSSVQKSDFLLVELTGTIPAGYNVFYNGWDRNSAANTGGVGIHHPSGDIKKISTYTGTLVSSTWNGQQPSGSHWRVTWTATTNGHGVTEGGSSGSPIFSSGKRIVGDLSGGGSFCNATSSPDYYGKFVYGWDQAGATAATQMKPWLDATATGVTTLDGRNACNVTPVAPVANFTGTPTSLMVGNNVTFTQTSTNNPTTFAWTLAPATGFAYQSGTSASSANPIIKFNTPGQYTVTLTASNTAGSDAETKTAYIKVFSNVGVEENEMAAAVKIFPNPSTDLVNIQLDKVFAEKIEIRVTDMMGKTVVQTAKPAGTTMVEIRTDQWAQGLYQIEISSGNYSVVKKLVKN